MRPRKLLNCIVAASVLVSCMAVKSLAFQKSDEGRCAGARDLRLTNGRIVTMDKRNSVVSELTIQNGRFAAVGKGGGQKLDSCTQTINLRGRTAVPGLIDNHNH